MARASIANNASSAMYSQLVSVEGNTAYVLSAYMWILGDNNHRVDVAVVDLDDAGPALFDVLQPQKMHSARLLPGDDGPAIWSNCAAGYATFPAEASDDLAAFKVPDPQRLVI